MTDKSTTTFGGLRFRAEPTNYNTLDVKTTCPHGSDFVGDAEWSTFLAAVHRAEAAEKEVVRLTRELDEARGCGEDLVDVLTNAECVNEVHGSLQVEVARLRELVNEIDGICTDTFTDPNDLIEQAITRHRAWEAKRG